MQIIFFRHSMHLPTYNMVSEPKIAPRRDFSLREDKKSHPTEQAIKCAPSIGGHLSKIGTSKKWVLPPKLKPGRKPKDKSLTATSAPTASPIHLAAKLQPESRSSSPGESNQVHFHETGLQAESLTQERSEATVGAKQAEENEKASINASVLSLDCGLCDSGGHCACDELGIKPKIDLMKPDTGPSFGIDFESFQPMKAVPLKRKSQANQNKVKKFRSLVSAPSSSSNSRQHISHQNPPASQETPTIVRNRAPIKAVPLESQLNQQTHHGESKEPSHDKSCGFCSTDHNDCLCASDKGATERHLMDVPKEIKAFVPGSCTNCLQDPMGTLFCISLSSAPKFKLPSPLTISCDAAYQTLKRHKKFFETQLADIVNNLEAENGRVDAQSVMRALQLMDNQK